MWNLEQRSAQLWPCLICSVQIAAEKTKVRRRSFSGCNSFLLSFLARLTLLMLQLQLNPCHPGRDNRRKKIKVRQTWRRAHYYLSGMYYIFCCCWMKSEVFQFEMLPWMSASTVKLIKSKHCSIHKPERVCTVGALSKQTVLVVRNFGLHADVHRGVCADPCGHGWMTIFTSRIPEPTRGCGKYELALSCWYKQSYNWLIDFPFSVDKSHDGWVKYDCKVNPFIWNAIPVLLCVNVISYNRT